MMKKIVFLNFTSIVFLLTTILVPIKSVYALSFGYFGGTITQTHFCTCLYDPAYIISVKDIKTKQTINLEYSFFFSMLYSNYNIWEAGPYVLGGYTPGTAVCLRQSGYYCTTDSGAPKPLAGMIDFVRGIGSSLTGGFSAGGGSFGGGGAGGGF